MDKSRSQIKNRKIKHFTKKVDVNLVISKINNLDEPCLFYSGNKIKISLYILLRLLKCSKRKYLNTLLIDNGISSKFEVNGFYISLIEKSKNSKVKILGRKLLTAKNENIQRNYFHPFPVFDCLQIDQKNLKNLSSGLEKFDKFYGDYSKFGAGRQVFFKTLKNQRFFNKIFISRLFLYASVGRKKYKTTFFYLLKKRRKLNSLFHVYTLSSLKFKELRQQRRKFFKRLAWKIKKNKKWKREGLHSVFRLRQKLSQVFYVPKHFEVNYKTLAACYLGYTDIKTTSTKIGFWLNLRKLLTFLL